MGVWYEPMFEFFCDNISSAIREFLLRYQCVDNNFSILAWSSIRSLHSLPSLLITIVDISAPSPFISKSSISSHIKSSFWSSLSRMRLVFQKKKNWLRIFFIYIIIFILYIDHYSSKGPTGKQVGPFDKFFLQIFDHKGHTHILTKNSWKKRVLKGSAHFISKYWG